MLKNKALTMVVLAILFIMAIVIVSGCTSQGEALQEAREIAANREYYVPINDVEARNYNWRLEISDQPSMVLWCTMFPPTPGVQPFTVPVIGKLTSGSKRPFPSENGSGYENPDAQSMYGSSGEYRYWFGPTGKYEYYDSYQLPTFCMTQPTVWQSQLTVIVQEKDNVLTKASQEAQAALARGDGELASQILNTAIKQLQGGQ